MTDSPKNKPQTREITLQSESTIRDLLHLIDLNRLNIDARDASAVQAAVIAIRKALDFDSEGHAAEALTSDEVVNLAAFRKSLADAPLLNIEFDTGEKE
jgi:hypothetical protein